MSFVKRAALIVVLGLVSSCKKPEMNCTTALGTFAVRYTLVSGSGACAELKGGRVGVQNYINRGSEDAPDYDKIPVALKVEAVGTLVNRYKQPVDATKVYSLGRFAESKAGGDNYCEVTGLSAAELRLAAVPAGTDAMGMPTAALPAVDARYEWNNVRFWVTPGSPGTQFTGDLTYTRDGCTAQYAVQGLYPAAGCGVPGTNGAGMMTMVPSQVNCSACADPEAGRAAGSHISPDVETVCDEATLLCLPAKPVPSLRAEPERCGRTSVPEPWPDAAPKDTAPAEDAAPTSPEGGVESGAETGDSAGGETGGETGGDGGGSDGAAAG